MLDHALVTISPTAVTYLPSGGAARDPNRELGWTRPSPFRCRHNNVCACSLETTRTTVPPQRSAGCALVDTGVPNLQLAPAFNGALFHRGGCACCSYCLRSGGVVDDKVAPSSRRTACPTKVRDAKPSTRRTGWLAMPSSARCAHSPDFYQPCHTAAARRNHCLQRTHQNFHCACCACTRDWWCHATTERTPANNTIAFRTRSYR